MAVVPSQDPEKRLLKRYGLILLISAAFLLLAVIALMVHDSKREWKTSPLARLLAREIPEDLHTASAPAGEYCVTCHQDCGETQRIRSQEKRSAPHPQANLFVSQSSSHPANRFGCVSCHGGQRGATGFISAGHSPSSDSQGLAWKSLYHFKPNPVPEFRMLPLPYTEANCLDCHRNRLRLEDAPLLSKGRVTFYQYGCAGCHSVEYAKSLPRTGPTLRGLNRKVSRQWALNWMMSPRKSKPESRMPESFGLSNSIAGDDTLDAAAMISFLFDDSLPMPVNTMTPAPANVKQGRADFENIGCVGCHSIKDDILPLAVNLRKSGNKLNSQWMMAWLKDPKKYSATASMPNLRLSDSETKDLTTFLLEQKGAEESPSIPVRWSGKADSLLLARLPHLSPAECREKTTALTPEQKFHLLGEQSLKFYGCYGCHEIRGMESLSPAGSALDNEGEKRVEDFDFGALRGKIPMERHSYLEQVMQDPRAFDTGRLRKPNDRLRMPQYRMSADEQKAVVCMLLSEKNSNALPSIKCAVTERDSAFNQGDEIILANRCNGCHTFFRARKPETGRIHASMTDSTLAPPMLYLEGKKIEDNWLFSFLDSVTTVRPWLKVRMPAFGFSADTLDRIVKHFTAESGLSGSEAYYDRNRVSKTSLALGKKLFTDFKCQTCHIKKGFVPDRPRDQWAPDIALTPKRMRVEWIVLWLKDPQKYVPGTKMPGYFFDYDETEKKYSPIIPDAEKSLIAIRDYMYAQ